MKAQTAQMSAAGGRGTVIQALNTKANAADQNAKTCEKTWLNGTGGGDCRAFLDEYIKHRKDYHKYSLLKVKVNQS